MQARTDDSADVPRRIMALGAEFQARTGDSWSMVAAGLPLGPLKGPTTHSPGSGAKAAWHGENLVGSRASLVPLLGDVIWELPRDLVDLSPYTAYVARVRDGRQVGCVRVPHYEYDDDAVTVFEQVIEQFERTTEAMVLDQTHNRGGSMAQMYALLALLTDRSLALPRHQLAVGREEETHALDIVRQVELGNGVPPEERPAPELVAYSEFVLSEITAGRRNPTNPVHLWGIEEIGPATVHYTKKLVVLIDALSFSAAEFLAAILQDNKRATLFGQRTAGAGGLAKRIYRRSIAQEALSLAYNTVRWTLAWRTNGEPIERVGVTPDVVYELKVDDLQYEFRGYQRALLDVLLD